MDTTTGRRTARYLVAAVVGAILVTSTTAPPATARQVEDATRDRGAGRVTYVDRYAPRRFYIETGDGAAYLVRRCRWEDDTRPCLWDAARRGNGRGDSFARLARGAGELAAIGPVVMRRAY